MNSRWSAPRFLILIASLVAALVTLGAATASARADTPIEGVWTFNGGKVAITEQPNGTFTGTVVAATKFAECTHPVGEEMWTKITPQPDGSYWGLHQWFFENSECARNPTLGLTAWRVLDKGESRLLRVCFSKPGIEKQPTIAPGGEAENATYGCVNSSLSTPVPELKPADFARYVNWPSNKACIGGKKLKIRISEPKNDPLTKVVVTLKSGHLLRKAKLKKRPSLRIAILSLRGLPKPQFTVKVRLTTVLGQHLSRKRHYVLCGGAKKPHSHGQGSHS